MEILALVDFRNKINIKNPAYAIQQSFYIQKTNFGNEKLDYSSLNIYDIVIATFWIFDMSGWLWLFQKKFLLTYIRVKIISNMFFITLNNVDVQLTKKKPT